jgi:hypothetical protein
VLPLSTRKIERPFFNLEVFWKSPAEWLSKTA